MIETDEVRTKIETNEVSTKSETSEVHTMRETDEVIEARIAEACKVAKGQQHPNLARLARDSNVPIGCLRSRLEGQQPLKEACAAPKKLKTPQEAALIQWIRGQCAAGPPPTKREIREAADGILGKTSRNGIHEPLSNGWAEHFVRKRLSSDMAFGVLEEINGVQSGVVSGLGSPLARLIIRQIGSNLDGGTKSSQL